MSEASFDFSTAHSSGMAFVVKEDIAFDPVNIGSLGADGAMFEPGDLTDLIQEFLRAFLHYSASQLTCLGLCGTTLNTLG